jgi:hypothetical protein
MRMASATFEAELDALLCRHHWQHPLPAEPGLAALFQRLEHPYTLMDPARDPLAPKVAAVLAALPAASAEDRRAAAWRLFTQLEYEGTIGIAPEAMARLLAELCIDDGTPAGRRLLARQALREELWRLDLCRTPVVPLGTSCFPWTFPARWGFQAAVDAPGRVFSPFALGEHDLDLVLETLERGWADYAPEGQVMRVVSGGGQPFVYRRGGGAAWNHHRDPHWFGDEFRSFHANIAATAAAFDALLRAPPWSPLVFLLGLWKDLDDVRIAAIAARALAALQGRVAGGAVRLFVAHVPRSEAGARLWAPLPGVVVLRQPPPAEEYLWYERPYFDSEAGFAFEHRFAEALRDAMLAWR